MLFVLALVAAVGYMFLTKQTIEANITDQVNEYLAEQQTSTHPGVQDSSHAEIKEIKKRVGSKCGTENFNEALAQSEKQQLMVAETELQQEARTFDARGGFSSMEPEGIYLEMSVYN
jgi:hypothetical protein